MANPVLIGQNSNASNTITSAAGTSTGGTGRVLYVTVSYDNGVTVSSISDNKSNTLSLIGSALLGNGGRLARYKCENFTGGASHTVTVNFSGTAYPTIIVTEIPTLLSSSPYDSAASATNVDATSPYTATSGTLAQAASVLMSAAAQNQGSNGSYSISTFTKLADQSDVGNYWTHGVAYLVVSATTAITPSWTRSGAADANTPVLVDVFKQQTGYSITADQGSYTLTGQTATLRVSRKIVAAQGSYSLTGQDAGLAYSGSARILTAAAGSYALTGQAANLRRGYRLVAAQGSYALTGQPAALKRQLKLTAAQGSYALTGSAALVDFAITASSGSYTLTGQAAQLRVTRKLVAAQGSYALTGQAAGLRVARKLAAAQGSYNLTGQDVTLTYSGSGAKLITAGQGSYTLAGQDVALRLARKLAAGQGSYALTGQAAGLLRIRRISVESGGYTLSGQDISFRRAYVLAAAQGSYTLTGQAVDLTYSAAPTPGVFETDAPIQHARRVTAARLGHASDSVPTRRLGARTK